MRILLKHARLFYATLVKPYQYQNNTPTYSITVILPKTDPQVANMINDAKKLCVEKYGSSGLKMYNSFNTNAKLPWQDGSILDHPDAEEAIKIAANNPDVPLLLSPARKPLTAEHFYRGCYVNSLYEIYVSEAWKRIGAKLLGVQFARHGARISAHTVTADAFEENSDDALFDGGNDSTSGIDDVPF